LLEQGSIAAGPELQPGEEHDGRERSPAHAAPLFREDGGPQLAAQETPVLGIRGCRV
jgi:hypothetical protein